MGLRHGLVGRNASLFFCSQAIGAAPLVGAPIWTLEDDNSGMDLMLQNQV